MEAEISQRKEIADIRKQGIQDIGDLMRDVRGLAEDMKEELNLQAPTLEQIDKNMDEGQKATSDAAV